MKKIYSLLLLVVSFASFGQVLTENFNFPDNSLLTANGWTAHNGGGTNAIDVGTSNGLTYAGYSGLTGFSASAVGNAAQLDNTGEDVNKPFAAPVTTGDLYLSFLVNVTNAVDGYFISLGTGTTTFYGRLYARPSATAGKINFGIGNSTATYSTTDFDPSTTYLAVIKYGVSTTGPVSLWILSSGIPATEVAAGSPLVTSSGSGSANVAGVYLRQYNASQNVTIDGILVYPTWFNTTPCPLTLGTEAKACDAVTFNIDTYNVNIPFTGGNSGTYNLSVNIGTISGANPSTTEAGDIIISNVPEGTNVTLTVTGACGFTRTIIAPDCKPINVLPYSESFPYTIGNSLNGEQKWSAVNTGDNILIASGSMAYPGITATGNSITFVGGGAESRTLFTSTNTGYVYASFIVTASDLANVTADLANTYFAVFTDATGATTNARVWIRKNGTQYQYGLGTGTAPTDWDPILYNAGDVQYVVLSYDFTGNTLSLFINPTIGGSAAPTVAVTPTTAYANFGGFLFRQETNNTTPTMLVDELRIDVTPNFTLGTSSNEISGLKIYPNPVTNGTLFIETAANATKTVDVYDVLGKLVLNTTTADNAVNVSALRTGVYIVNISEEGKTASRKLVIK